MRQFEERPDLRFDAPLYGLAEAAGYLDVALSTFTNWSKGYRRQRPDGTEISAEPVVTLLAGQEHRQPSVPFVGLVEGLAVAALRRSGLPLQRVRAALGALDKEIGVSHALASRRLYTDGAELLYDFAEGSDDAAVTSAARNLVVVRNGQRVFVDVVADYLRLIDYAGDGFAAVVHLPRYAYAEVVVDPTRSFGKPIFQRGGARVADVLERFWVGESLNELTEEFGVPETELEDAVRVASRRAA
ncbi:MAG: DUF433 domain-containing protein [Candidatus Dormibacteria bacterium]